MKIYIVSTVIEHDDDLIASIELVTTNRNDAAEFATRRNQELHNPNNDESGWVVVELWNATFGRKLKEVSGAGNAWREWDI